jgi:outer membrane protein TolC
VPVFERGRQQARIATASADLQRRRALLADMRGSIDYDVRSAFLDLHAAEQALEAARIGRDLASQQLVQSRDRFSAGVAGSLEVVQSQEAVATANDHYTSALYAHNIAKASLARAVGVAEDATKAYLGGAR